MPAEPSLFGNPRADYFRDYNTPERVPDLDENGQQKIDPTTNQPKYKDRVDTNGNTVYTAVDTLTEPLFDAALNKLRFTDANVVRHLFETLDLDGNGTLTLAEFDRAIQILVDMASRTGNTTDLHLPDWKKMKAEDGALEHVYSRNICGVKLLKVFQLTNDPSNTKSFFEINKEEFKSLIDRLGLFRNWPEAGLKQNRKYAVDYLWSLLSSDGVIKPSIDAGKKLDDRASVNVVLKQKRFIPISEKSATLKDESLSIQEIEEFVLAGLGTVLDGFMLQFYHQQEAIYRRISDSFKKM